MLENSALQKQTKLFSSSLQCAFFCLVMFITNHNALAQLQFYPAPQPQINYEMTKGEVQFLEAVGEPMYPTRASSRSIIGWAEVSFDVDTNGLVIAETAKIIDAEPRGIFDSATIRAVRILRFIPYAPNGTAQIVTGVQYRFQYSM